ncbi:MAG: ribosomal protein methyltransferase [Ilumatobacteraceae bacterium]
MLALVVSVDTADVELASDVLWSLGVVAIEERSQGGGVELWTSVGDDVESTSAVLSARLARWQWRYVVVDESVADNWRIHARPVRVDADLVICPAWVPFGHEPGTTVLRIEPGSTFGLGDHPTTILSMRAVRAAVHAGSTVLDVGCGSGVLAVGACLFGAASATAIDISPASVAVTEANASVNGVGERVHVSNTPLADVAGRFDVVVANILAPTLIELADDLRRVMTTAGTLIVSGVLAEHHLHVEEALHPLRRVDRTTMDGWAALTLSDR